MRTKNQFFKAHITFFMSILLLAQIKMAQSTQYLQTKLMNSCFNCPQALLAPWYTTSPANLNTASETTSPRQDACPGTDGSNCYYQLNEGCLIQVSNQQLPKGEYAFIFYLAHLDRVASTVVRYVYSTPSNATIISNDVNMTNQSPNKLYIQSIRFLITTNQKVKIVVCDSPAGQTLTDKTFVGRFSLTQAICDASTQIKKPLTNGIQVCIPKDVADFSQNCKAFVKNGAVYECAQCDLTKSAPILVTIKANNQFYKGCAQVSVSNVANYLITQTKDKNGLKILVPLNCISGSPGSGTVAIPSYSNHGPTQRDETGVLCRLGDPGIKIWEYLNNAYIPAVCKDGYEIVDLDINSKPKPETTKGCIMKSSSNPKYDSQCLKYNSNFECTTCRLKGVQVSPLSVNNLGQISYKCPTNSEVEPSLRNQCLSYSLNAFGVRTCNNCPKPNILLPRQNNIQLCLSQTIKGCKYYKPDRTCQECYSGVPYDSATGACPSAETAIPGCDNLNTFGSTVKCNGCKAGFILTFDSRCTKVIPFCSVYAGEICKTCITDYFWNGRICVKNILKCQNYNENGECTQCSSQRVLLQGLCIIKISESGETTNSKSKITCQKGQYLQKDEICVNGNVKFCENYNSPSGDCSKCENGYKLNSRGQCQVICPSDTQTEKYIIKNNICIKTDSKCVLLKQDGYCSQCDQNHYAFEGKCYLINAFNLMQVSPADEQEDVIIKITDQTFLKRSDGSRVYVDGPLKDKQVWEDEKGLLYEKIPNNGRRYLNGPYANMNSFVDESGRRYSITNATKINYFESDEKN